MENLAFTFPVFELGAVATMKNIVNKDFHVCTRENFWQLAGDGAQTTITLEQLTDRGTNPLIVRLSVGPVSDGVGRILPTYVYKFERIANGWRRLEYKVVEQDIAPNDR